MSGIQGALKFWQEFNICEFQVRNTADCSNYLNSYDCMPLLAQKDLDVEGQAVAKRQDESEISRKTLVELSREFKKSSSEVSPQYRIYIISHLKQ